MVKEVTLPYSRLLEKVIMKAITLYPFIIYNGEPTDRIRSHEKIHIEQVEREGFFKFYYNYLRNHFKYGYSNNPYEIEAYSRETK